MSASLLYFFLIFIVILVIINILYLIIDTFTFVPSSASPLDESIVSALKVTDMDEMKHRLKAILRNKNILIQPPLLETIKDIIEIIKTKPARGKTIPTNPCDVVYMEYVLRQHEAVSTYLSKSGQTYILGVMYGGDMENMCTLKWDTLQNISTFIKRGDDIESKLKRANIILRSIIAKRSMVNGENKIQLIDHTDTYVTLDILQKRIECLINSLAFLLPVGNVDSNDQEILINDIISFENHKSCEYIENIGSTTTMIAENNRRQRERENMNGLRILLAQLPVVNDSNKIVTFQNYNQALIASNQQALNISHGLSPSIFIAIHQLYVSLTSLQSRLVQNLTGLTLDSDIATLLEQAVKNVLDVETLLSQEEGYSCNINRSLILYANAQGQEGKPINVFCQLITILYEVLLDLFQLYLPLIAPRNYVLNTSYLNLLNIANATGILNTNNGSTLYSNPVFRSSFAERRINAGSNDDMRVQFQILV